MVTNKAPPGGVFNVKPSYRVGKNLINTGWVNDQYEPIYQAGARFYTEKELFQKGILVLPKNGGTPGRATLLEVLKSR